MREREVFADQYVRNKQATGFPQHTSLKDG